MGRYHVGLGAGVKGGLIVIRRALEKTAQVR